MKLGAEKPKNVGQGADEPKQTDAAPTEVAETAQQPQTEAAATEPKTPAPTKILFAETIGTDGKSTLAHEAELARIAERAAATNGRDPSFRQKNFADWHGWCHWKACFARVMVALHQADADKWEARKKGRDLDKEESAKARIQAEVKKINAQRAKIGKPPLTVEQAEALLS